MLNFLEKDETNRETTRQIGSFREQRVFSRGHIFSGNPTVQHVEGWTGPETAHTECHIIPKAKFLVVE